MKRLVTTLLVGALLAAPSAAGALLLSPATTPATAAHFQSGDGLRVLSVKAVNSRLIAVAVKTAALPVPANIYVLLPPDYASAGHRRFPVFYLLHGTSGRASDWTLQGHAQSVIGERELITVMPDIAINGDGGGWCTNWPDGAERWETFHMDQLVPWIDANLRTIRMRGARAIAGLSQGGFCSMSYAARHPDLFGTALAYSGAPEIYYDPVIRAGALAIINGTEVGLDHVAPDTFFGNPVTDGINWAAHDPATLAENLRWTKMYLYWGNGLPGPYDNPASPNTGAMAIEGAVSRSNQAFQSRVNALGVPAYFDAYGPGTHSWPYWTRDLRWSIDKIMFDFAHPAGKPSQFSYTSAENRYAVYGWSVAMHRTAREFSTLAQASCRGFALSGSGSATVLTPACYRRGIRYRVTLSGPHARGSRVLRAGRSRRLTLRVLLGPSNPYQEDTAQAQAAGTAVYTAYVTVRRAR